MPAATHRSLNSRRLYKQCKVAMHRRHLLALLLVCILSGYLAACQDPLPPTGLPQATPPPVGLVDTPSTREVATAMQPTPAITDSVTTQPATLQPTTTTPTPLPAPPNVQSVTVAVQPTVPLGLSLTFGVENAHELYRFIGNANVFGRTRIPVDERSFDADGYLNMDFRELVGLREYVVKALAGGHVAMVIDVQAEDSPQRVQNKVRSVLALNPQAPPWLLIMGNELNLKSDAAYPVETYYAQFRAATDAAKAIDPKVQLSLDGENAWDGVNSPEPGLHVESTARLRQILALCQRDSFSPDYIALHVYDSVFAPSDTASLRSLDRRTEAYQSLMLAYHLPKQPHIYIGEYGLPVVDPLPANQLYRYDRLIFSEAEQETGAFLSAAWSMARGVELNYYSSLDVPTAARRLDTGEGAYGLVTRRGRQRPAFAALRHAQILLADVTETHVLADGHAGYGALQFVRADGSSVWVAQATTSAAATWMLSIAAVQSVHVEDSQGNLVPDAMVPGSTLLQLPPALAERAGGPVRVVISTGPYPHTTN